MAKEYKLDLSKTLLALDCGNKNYYIHLTDEEKKSYSPLLLMRYMSSLSDQNHDAAGNIMLVNYIVNIGFWSLSKHPELLHLLLCTVGSGRKQYHQWIPLKSKQTKSKFVDDFLLELYPGMNTDELNIMRASHDISSIKSLAIEAGKSDSEIKVLVENAKKIY